MTNIIDGKEIASQLRAEIKKKVDKLSPKPGLAFILVGKDPASQVYVNSKHKACEEVGIKSKVIELKETTNVGDILQTIEDLNEDKNIHGMIVQLPLPEGINKDLVIDAILPYKDADGLSPVNIGALFADQPRIIPATPSGIIKLIKSTGQKIAGKNAVVLGRSTMVGKPTAALLLKENATVTVCHSKSKNTKEMCRNADIIVAAIGKPKFVTKNMVKPGAIIIDVGINRENEKLVGDVDYDNVKVLASHITPVPKGVGPMTVACLLENTLTCYELQKKFS